MIKYSFNWSYQSGYISTIYMIYTIEFTGNRTQNISDFIFKIAIINREFSNKMLIGSDFFAKTIYAVK